VLVLLREPQRLNAAVATGGTGHNTRTCQAGAADNFESSSSTQFILSDNGGNNNDD
jgi:hypothetical protein